MKLPTLKPEFSPISRLAALMRRVSLRRQEEMARPLLGKNQTQKPHP